MPTNVLHLITSTDRRGAETFATELDAWLGETFDGGVVALRPGSHGGLDVPTLTTGGRSVGMLRALRDAARSADVAVAHGASTLAATALGTLGLGTPWVYRNIGDPRYWAGSRARRLRVTPALRRADAVVVLWPGAADAIRAQHRVDDAKIHVVPNGVPHDGFPPTTPDERAAARARLQLPDDRIVVAYVGALSPEKLVHVAVDAVAAIPEAVLLVVGDGPDRQGLERRATEVAPGRVRFVGSVAETRGPLAAADALVLPSRTEGIPAVLIEAGLMRLPCVATDVGGVGEVIVDGDTGLLVPADDVGATTRALVEAVDRRAVLGPAARARCLERFSMEVVGRAWAQVLHAVAH